MKNLIRNLIKFLVVCLIILLMTETSLRLLGYRIPARKDYKNEPLMHETDDILGWKFKPGSYKFVPFYSETNDSIQVTITHNKGRVTRKPRTPVGADKVFFIGGSYTFGHGLSDHETFPWKLQERFKSLDIRNLGVGAYGTYQSLLVLESAIKTNPEPKAAVYGLIDHHKFRNVAGANWQEVIYHNSREIYPKIPYIKLDENGDMLRNAPLSMQKLPLSNYLLTMFLAQRVLLKFNSREREQDVKALEKAAIKQMKNICDQKGIKFYVAILACERRQKEELILFFEENNIKYIDCHIELKEDNTIKGDGHPDATVNSIWAERIGLRFIGDQISSIEE